MMPCHFGENNHRGNFLVYCTPPLVGYSVPTPELARKIKAEKERRKRDKRTREYKREQQRIYHRGIEQSL